MGSVDVKKAILSSLTDEDREFAVEYLIPRLTPSQLSYIWEESQSRIEVERHIGILNNASDPNGAKELFQSLKLKILCQSH